MELFASFSRERVLPEAFGSSPVKRPRVVRVIAVSCIISFFTYKDFELQYDSSYWIRFSIFCTNYTEQGNKVAQVLRADRAAFTRIAESLASIKRKPDGALPLDKALDEIIQDPSVSFHLLPLKASEQDDRKRKVYDDPKKPDDANKLKKPFKENKGKGKWKDKDKVGTKGAKFIKMPKQLVGKASETGDGKRLCWAYNIDGCPNAEDGEECPRGWHLCCEPGCFKPHPLPKHRK